MYRYNNCCNCRTACHSVIHGVVMIIALSVNSDTRIDNADPVPFMEVALTLAKGLGTNTSELSWGFGGSMRRRRDFFGKCANVLTDFYHFCMVPGAFLALRNRFFTSKNPEIGKGLNFF